MKKMLLDSLIQILVLMAPINGKTPGSGDRGLHYSRGVLALYNNNNGEWGVQ